MYITTCTILYCLPTSWIIGNILFDWCKRDHLTVLVRIQKLLDCCVNSDLDLICLTLVLRTLGKLKGTLNVEELILMS